MSRQIGKVPDEALVAERRAHSKHWPRSAARRSPVPGVLHTEPEFQVFEEERRAIFDAQARVRGQVASLDQRNELVKAKHVQALKLAMESGEPLPVQPDLEVSPIPPELHSAMYWGEKHKSVEAAEMALLVDRAEHWKSRLKVSEAREQVRLTRNALAEAEAHLKPLTGAVEAIDRIVQPIREAAESRARKKASLEANDVPWREMRSPRSRASIDLLTQLAEANSSPPSPLKGRR